MALADLVKNRHKAAKKGHVTLLTALDEFLLLREDEDRRDGKFHPSDLSGDFCPRSWVLYNYHPNGKTVKDGSWDARFRRILTNGHHVHARLHRYLQEMGVLWGKWRRPIGLTKSTGTYRYEYTVGWTPRLPDGSIDLSWEYTEIRIQNDPENIIGHTDGAINITGSKEAVEFKGWNDYGFKRLGGKPTKAHREQGLIYLAALEWMRQEKAQGRLGGFVDAFDALPFTGVRVIYENKNDQTIEEFHVPWDPAEYEKMMEPKRPLMALAAGWGMGDPLPDCTCGRRVSPLCKARLTFA